MLIPPDAQMFLKMVKAALSCLADCGCDISDFSFIILIMTVISGLLIADTIAEDLCPSLNTEVCRVTWTTLALLHIVVVAVVVVVVLCCRSLVQGSVSRVAVPRFDSRSRRGDFSGSSHTSGLKIDTPVATLPGQHWDWLARCQYIVTGLGRKFDLQLLSRCGRQYICQSRSVPEIH